MIDAQNDKVLIAQAASVSNTTDTIVVDRRGFDYVSIDLILGTAAATTAPTVLKIQESDTTDASNYSDITEFVGGGTGGFTIPARVLISAAEMYARFCVDCRGKKRYLRTQVTLGTTASSTQRAGLSRAETAPITAAGVGAKAFVRA